jgi:predicted nucleic acid-binding protein
MAFVVDASVSACWALDDEDHAIATVALDRSKIDSIIVPSLWWFEIRNLLVMAERRKRFTATKTNTFLHSLRRLDLSIDHSPSSETVMDLARRHGLTVYDSGYLELALRHDLPLATLDKKLAAAAAREGASLIA